MSSSLHYFAHPSEKSRIGRFWVKRVRVTYLEQLEAVGEVLAACDALYVVPRHDQPPPHLYANSCKLLVVRITELRCCLRVKD
jgi:hypothetical protein